MSAIESNLPLNLNIYDVQGKLVFAETYKAKSKQSINVSSFNNGVYFIRLQTDKNVYKQNLIKN